MQTHRKNLSFAIWDCIGTNDIGLSLQYHFFFSLVELSHLTSGSFILMVLTLDVAWISAALPIWDLIVAFELEHWADCRYVALDVDNLLDSAFSRRSWSALDICPTRIDHQSFAWTDLEPKMFEVRLTTPDRGITHHYCFFRCWNFLLYGGDCILLLCWISSHGSIQSSIVTPLYQPFLGFIDAFGIPFF